VKIKPDRKNYSNAFKYTNLAFQMAVLVLIGTLGGNYLDKNLKLGFPIFLLIGSLGAVFIGLYLMLKDFIKKKD